MRFPTVAPISFCKATENSQQKCIQINNLYREGYTTEQIADEMDMSKTAVRYYYYGIHNCSEAHFHWKNAFEKNKEMGYIQYSLNQVRKGTCVPL
jgi:orotate phosphoribosyltransferase-like protein